jgi:2-aminoadipate transaminase
VLWREENVVGVNPALRDPRDALVQALEELIPEAEFDAPAGGYFLWLDLEDDVDTEALLTASQAEGATFVAGPDFMISGGKSSLRLSFASVPADQIPEGVSRIARALEQLRAGAPA